MRILLLVVALTACTAPSWARQGLPQSVVEPYRAYQAALEAGDMPALVDASGRALEAARAERLDDGTLGVLTENHAYALASAGRDADAMEYWEDAARLGERAGLARIDLAWRWHNAAASALRADALQQARRWSDEATELIGRFSADEGRAADFEAEAWFLAARIDAQAGRPDLALIPAREALRLYQVDDRPPDYDYAYLHYLAGLASASMTRSEDAVYHLHMARDIAHNIPGASDAFKTRVNAMLTYFEGTSSLSQGWDRLPLDIDERLAADPLHASRFADWEHEEPEPERPEGYVAAEPVRQDSPRYPRDAAMRAQQGFVVLRFDIETTGRTSHVEIVDAFPRGAFEEEAIETVEDWIFTPATLDGEPVRQDDVMTHFHFALG